MRCCTSLMAQCTSAFYRTHHWAPNGRPETQFTWRSREANINSYSVETLRQNHPLKASGGGKEWPCRWVNTLHNKMNTMSYIHLFTGQQTHHILIYSQNGKGRHRCLPSFMKVICERSLKEEIMRPVNKRRSSWDHKICTSHKSAKVKNIFEFGFLDEFTHKKSPGPFFDGALGSI